VALKRTTIDKSAARVGDPALPLVSIVTPSYNQGRFIRETIESVLSQDYPNLEYWVIDAASADETVGILREYERDPRFHWVSEPDGGQSDAINKGIARSRGELFAWLNADDVLLPGALGKVAEAHRAGRPALLYGRVRLIDHAGRDIGYLAAQRARMTRERLLDLRFFLPQPATFAPTEWVRRVGGLDTSLHYAMDLDLWVRLAEYLPIRHVPHNLALYRMHSASKTVAQSARFIGDVAAVLDRAAARGMLTARQARARALLFGARIYFTPEGANARAGLASLVAAVRVDRSVALDACFIAAKALARLALGERAWSLIRLAQVKLR
jgi:glycosyltransferase involved in cell wall biosynthesis